MYWGDEVLDYRQLEPGSGFDFAGRPLIAVDDHGGATLCLWPELEDESEIRRSPSEAPVALGAIRDELPPRLALIDGFAAELVMGDITFGVTCETPVAEPFERSSGRDTWRAVASSLGVGALVVTGLAWSAISMPPPWQRAEAREDERIELARQFLVRAAEREVELTEAEGGMSVRAPGSEGSAGTRYGVRGPSAGALHDAAEFGMMGLLASGAGGLESYGSGRSADTPVSRGSLWGAAIDGALEQPAFEHPGVNGPTDPARDPVSTFAVDVDTGSYTIVRRALRAGSLPLTAAVRAEEMINYFDYGYTSPASTDAHPFATHIDAAPSPYDDGHIIVRVAVQAKRLERAERRPAHLVYLVDTSGSMRSYDKMGLVKTSLRLLTQSLRPDDTVALCTYAGNVREVLAPTKAAHEQKILDAIDGLDANGATAMASGIDLAYRLAERTLVPGDVNRVVILSDGDANVGASSHEELTKQIERYRKKGITLSTVGFGTGNYRDAMMERLADEGDGNYRYVDDAAQARRVFVDEVDGLLEVVARDVKVQVELDPRYVRSYRLIGYENRDVADDDFRDDEVDGGEIGAGHSVTALYDVVLHPVVFASAGSAPWLDVRLRYKLPVGSEKATEVTYALSASDIAPTFDMTPTSFRMATAVAGLAEILRESPHAKGWSLEEVEEVAHGVPAAQADRAELVELTAAARGLIGS